ncbi:GDP-4-dehydro-6-deoxy-D-mannose reductase [Methanomicrobium sp. W14]|uniref:GDP-mannose 4,6-dehydratase n=1 Tax=Methanomicrobium sp. W14 TaxID=2817839 RepID=UPI001AE29642|nr:GDP-mannose 4,6-dehydratase [Methanomicrobium sp. W14]MBP2134461.1 GDP-4-dehydro-6-deoxy-D-mannose reductase [Methanomicrobium sp. W14]
MKRILITGISGFVGGHFVDYLKSAGKNLEIIGISRHMPSWDFVGFEPDCLKHYEADLNDLPRVKSIIEDTEPDYILHLAAQSSVAESWKTPVDSFMNNTNIFLNVIDTVRRIDNGARVLSVGSSEQYGIVSENDLPLSETRKQSPENPYAVARVSQELLAGIYARGYGLDICCTRSFNHCGPGQRDKFVVSSIAKQFAMIKKGLQEPILHIGNGSIIRDFVDVHDVVSAYCLLLEKGKRGGVYNICSGVGRSILDIINILSEMYGTDVDVRQESSQIRPIDNPRIVGDFRKIHDETGWKPKVSFEDSLRSVYEYWDKRISA